MSILRSGDRIFGWMIVAIIIFQALFEWTGMDWMRMPLLALIAVIVAIMAAGATQSGRVFLLVSAGLTAALLVVNDNWQSVLWDAVVKTGFLASFFSALTILRNAASSSLP